MSLACSLAALKWPDYEMPVLITQTLLFVLGLYLLYVSQTRIKENLLVPLAYLQLFYR